MRGLEYYALIRTLPTERLREMEAIAYRFAQGANASAVAIIDYRAIAAELGRREP